MSSNQAPALDVAGLSLDGDDLQLAKVLAEETAAERKARKTVAFVAPSESEHTVEQIEAMPWDELLVLDGECFIRCWERSQLPPDSILEFVETHCEPSNRLAVRWFRLYVQKLNENQDDAAATIARIRAESAKSAADARHNRPGGSRHKRQQIRDIWASGKYSSRDICAEQECAALGMSPSTARRALQGTPEPERPA